MFPVPVTLKLICLVPSSPSAGRLAGNTSILVMSVAAGLRAPVQFPGSEHWDPAGLSASFSTPFAAHAPICNRENAGVEVWHTQLPTTGGLL